MKPLHPLLLLAALLAAPLALLAQGPNGTGTYYRPAHGKSGAELKTAMHLIIRQPKVVGYGGLKEAYMKTDVREDGYLRDWYSSVTAYEPGSAYSTATSQEGSGYNREHLLPQSWFGKKADPMYSDIVHVVPVDGHMNTIRNDNPFGEVTDQTAQVSTSRNGYCRWGAPSATLDVPKGLTKVFEPNDEVKGDIARIYFYMLTCYEDTLHTWPWRDSRTAVYVFDEEGTAYRPLQPWVMDMLMRWSQQDPVDSVETARNNAVFRVQGNRNPFVDYPGLEQYVWGDRTEEPFAYSDDADDGPDAMPANVTIALNSRFFGGEWTGSRPAMASSVVRGQQDGITVEYALGNEGRNMYLGNDHIRLYQKNLLVVSTQTGVLDDITFSVTKNDAKKVLMTGDTAIGGYHWTGSEQQVAFHLDDGNGVFYLAAIKVHRTETDAITAPYVATWSQQPQPVYDLTGRRVDATHLTPGIYVCQGRKFVVH